MRMLAVVALLAACSSHYMPRSRGRVGVVMQGGSWGYARDGEVYPHGFLGSGLQDAVRGNPAAEADAAEYHARLRDGFIAGIIGAICLPVSVSYIAVNAESSNDNAGTIGVGAALGCTALMLGGMFYTISAEPYRWDAINRFNDTEPEQPVQGPPGYRF